MAPQQWRHGIFAYSLYHLTAHEPLGIAADCATLRIRHRADATSKAHSETRLFSLLEWATADRSELRFLVVGAYPQDQDWDLCREAPSEAARDRMAALPIPDCDPLDGETSRLGN